jgi:ubiquitin-protein ligase
MNARIRRLTADFNGIVQAFSSHPYIKVQAMEGNPPIRYLVTYNVTGIRWDKRLQKPVESNFHQAEIYLHRDYPRIKPRCVTKTEIFHPNFGDWICIGDYWAAGEKLTDIIIQIGQMIQYQKYNVKSPVNVTAARWAAENASLLPIGRLDLYLPEPETQRDNHLFSNSNTLDLDLDTDSNETSGQECDLEIQLL